MPGDDHIIEEDVVRVSPDLTGFRRKLQRDLRREMAGIQAEVDVQARRSAQLSKLATSWRDGPALMPKSTEPLDKQLQQLGTRIKRLRDAENDLFKQVRSNSEKLRKDYLSGHAERERLAKAESDQYFKDLGNRTRLSLAGLKATQKANDDAARAEHAAREETWKGLRRNLDLSNQAKAAAEARAKADETAARTRAVKESEADRRIGDMFAELNRFRRDNELGLMDDLSRARAQTDRDAITDRHALERVRITALDAESRAEKASIADTERADKASQARRRSARNDLKQSLTGPKLIDLGGQGFRPMNILYGAVTAMTPALFAMASSAVQASTAVASLGTAGVGAATGISALVGAFSGLGDALKLSQSARKASLSAKAPKAAISNDGALRNSRNAIAAANRRVGDSERSLADALRDEAKAQAAIGDARKEALQDLIDLREAVSDLRLEQKRADLDLMSAKDRQREVNANFWATDLDRATAAQDVAEAEEKVSDTATERIKKAKELAVAEKKGINGSDKVVAAQEKAADAHRTVIDRQRDVADAVLAVKEAQLDLADAMKTQAVAAAGASAASDQLADKLARETQEFRDLFYFLDGPGRDSMDGFRHRMQRIIDPAVLQFLKDLGVGSKSTSSLFAMFSDSSANMGKVIADNIAKLGKTSKEGWFKADAGTLFKQSEESAKHFGNAAQIAIKPVMAIFAESAPLLTRFSIAVENTATKFAAFIDAKRKSGELADWFRKAGDEFALWVDLAKQVGRFLLPIFNQSLPTGNNLVTRLRDFVKVGADWANSPAGATAIAGFFDKFKNLKYGEISKFLGDLTVTVLTFKAFKLAVKNPFYALLALLIESNPSGFVAIVNGFANILLPALKWMSDHEGWVAVFTGMFLAMKGLRSLDIGIKLPGIDNLKSYLINKFSWLGGSVGLTSKTAVMTVHAGVVNISGGVDIPTVVPGGTAGTKGKTTTGGKVAQLATGTASGAAGGLAGIGVMAALTVGTMVVEEIAEDPGGFFEKLKNSLDPTNARWETDKEKAARLEKVRKGEYGTKLDRARTTEADRHSKVKIPMANATGLTAADADASKSLQDWIKARDEAVKKNAEYINAMGDAQGAQDSVTRETQKSRYELKQMLIQQGMNSTQAEAYATKVYGVSEADKILSDQLTYKTTPDLHANALAALAAANEARGLGTAIDDIDKNPIIKLQLDGVPSAEANLTAIKEDLSKIIGRRVIDVDLVPGSDVDKKLEQYNIQQMALKNGGDYQKAKNDYNKDKRLALRGYNTGGRITGISAHNRADDQIAAVTANEWVMPVKSVQKYGPAKMTAIQHGLLPANFADGGIVGHNDKWPFFLAADAPAAATPGASGGAASDAIGNLTGAGGYKWMEAALKAQFGNGVRFFADYATSGHAKNSYHYRGRAVDMTPSMDVFNWIKSNYGAKSAELIYSPAGNAQLRHGQPHMYTGRTRSMHFNHVHWAYADGGQVPAIFDQGGVLAPGINVVNNATGSPEPLVPPGLNRLDPRDIALLASHIARAVSGQQIAMNGRRVAETVNSYSYLPGTF